MAEKEGMKGLRLRSKLGQILWDLAWIAGVDYMDNDEDDDNDDDDDDEIQEDENEEDENEGNEADDNDSQQNEENESLYDESDLNEIFDDNPDANESIQHASNPNQDDWMKLTRMMKFLKQSRKDCLTLKSDGS
jgi:TATA-binding protein-associated factor Taf7